jgi:hypothetical protein
MRIFSLEYIRQRLNSDQVNFVSKKRKATFKLKKEVGPFVVNNRAALQVVEILLQEMNFQQGEIWHYDPYSIISTKRIEVDLSPYEHHSQPQLEQLMNQYSWDKVQKNYTGSDTGGISTISTNSDRDSTTT